MCGASPGYDKLERLHRVYATDGASAALRALLRYPLDSTTRSQLGDTDPLKFHLEKLLAATHLGYWPQVRDPRTFNEHVLHRKLCTANRRFAQLEDKWRAREYVKDRIGDWVLPEVYHVTDDAETIPYESLPGEFVVKATHGCGMNQIVEDKSTVYPGDLEAQCEAWLNQTFGKATNEYWYADIPPRILVEEHLQDAAYGTPPDYKFLVFDGTAEYVEVHFDRFGATKNRLFDRQWNAMDVEYDYPVGPAIDEPVRFDEMLDIAETLGTGFDFLRVDLYQPTEHRVVFGEFSIAPAAGRGRFDPIEFDHELGSYW